MAKWQSRNEWRNPQASIDLIHGKVVTSGEILRRSSFISLLSSTRISWTSITINRFISINRQPNQLQSTTNYLVGSSTIHLAPQLHSSSSKPESTAHTPRRTTSSSQAAAPLVLFQPRHSRLDSHPTKSPTLSLIALRSTPSSHVTIASTIRSPAA